MANKLVPARMADFNIQTKTPQPTLISEGGIDVDFKGKDCDILISVETSPVTVKAGNGLQGVMDLVVNAGNSVALDSGCFKNVKGEHKGCVHIEGTGAKVWAIELP